MSNPAVFRLNKSNIRGNVISIEDNIGESIHIHMGLVRFDLTTDELHNITKTLLSVLNEQVAIEGFDLSDQNEYFLERIALGIPYIESVEEDYITPNSLRYLYENDKGDIVEDYVINTPLYKFYCGSADIINDYEIKRDIWETKEETLERVRTRRNNDVYVNERNLVLDGYKSVCAGLAMGDLPKKIKVKRIKSLCDELSCLLAKEKREW